MVELDDILNIGMSKYRDFYSDFLTGKVKTNEV